jgi:HD-GYP domain-containing protein (c-di-GMP phosphodiesterase class II)
MLISSVPDGAKLARDLWTGSNSQIPLLRAGTAITPRYREALMNAGLRAVYIDDEFSAGIDIVEPVREHVRRQAADTVDRTMTEIRSALDGGSMISPDLVGNMTSIANMLAAEVELCAESIGMSFGDLAAADAYTFQHSIDVAPLGMVLAHRLFNTRGWIDANGKRRLDGVDQRLVRIGLGLLLHDVGKMIIPAHILNKPGPLDANEWELMRRHPVAGYDLLAQTSLSPLVTVVVRSHHERWDGTGYPDARKGDRIHQFARIAAVADVFDAVTSERPYKPAAPNSAGVRVIEEGRGTHFDPECVETFLKTVAPCPPGTEVLLSDGRRGVVAAVPDGALDRPIVRLLPEPGEPASPPVEIALTEFPQLTFTEVTESPSALGRAA